jgi:hypothetical protein
MAVSSPEQLREDIVRLVHGGANVREFSLGAARILARAVPFDGVCVLTMDPATLVPTGEFVENGLPPSAFARMAELEHRGEDFNAFSALALGGRHAASLSAATEGELDRSRRHREVRSPNGFGDELRAVLTEDSRVWGALTLLRGYDHGHFAPAHSAAIASVSSALAKGLRRAMLLDAGPLVESADGRGSPCSHRTTRSWWPTPPPSGGSPSSTRRTHRSPRWSPRWRAGRAASPRDAPGPRAARVRGSARRPATGCWSAPPRSATTMPRTSR